MGLVFLRIGQPLPASQLAAGESAREQLRAVLTEEQRTQLQEMRLERRGR